MINKLPKRRGNQASSTRKRGLRIIGGAWRGRRIDFVELPALRPTPDRVRETLFNWLQPIIPGTVCLDLFAGSGALGFEAASRGAERVILVENHPRAVRQLQDVARRLQAGQIEIVQADALSWLQLTTEHFDVVLLDPPFYDDGLRIAIKILAQRNLLKHDARVYIEIPSDRAAPELPAGWTMTHRKQAGHVAYCLARVELYSHRIVP
jgi:16S rRNA (guanine966-N2)-methyltransferase